MTSHLLIKTIATIAAQDLPVIGAKNATLNEMPSFLNPKEKLTPDGIAETAEGEATVKLADKLAEPVREDEVMVYVDDQALIERDHTYVQPSPVTNWEWEQEKNGGTYLK